FDMTRYMPAEGAREDKPVNVPAAEPGTPGGSSVSGPSSSTPAPAPTTPPAAPAPTTPPAGGGGTTPPTQAPQSLFDVHQGDFRMGVPVPQVRPVFSTKEQRDLALKSSGGTELRFPVVSVTF